MSRVAVVTLTALACLASLAVPAAAQEVGSTSVDLTLPNLGAPVRPGDPQNNSVTVRYQWSNGMSQDNTTVRLEVVEEPPWLNSTFSPSTVEFDTATRGPQGVQARIVNLTLSVAPMAPAYQEATAVYRAVAEQNGVLQQATVETEFPVTAGFRGRVNATLVGDDNVTAWGGLVTHLPIRLENRANGPVAVQAEVVRSPADAQIRPFEEVEIGPNGNVTTADLEVLVPWSVSLSGPVVVEFNPVHAQRGTPLRSEQVRFQLEGNSAVPIPSAGPWAALAAVGAALVLRRDR